MPPQDVLSQQLYWLNKLSGYRPGPRLLAGFPGHPLASVSRQRIDFTLSSELSGRILQVSKRSDLAGYAVLVSGLAILAGWYSGTTETVVFSPIYSVGETGEGSGLLPLRIKLPDELSYKEFLRSVGRTIIESYANQDCMVQQTENTPAPTIQGLPHPFVSISLDKIHTVSPAGIRGEDIALSFTILGDGIAGTLEYDDALCDKSAAEGLLDHYRLILHQALEDVSSTLASLASGVGRELVSSSPEREYGPVSPPDATFGRLLAEQGEKTPDRVAASCSGEFVSYGYLNAASNAISERISSSGIGSEGLVAVYSRRGIHFLTAIVGILKAGRAYLPLDPSMPQVRLVGLVTQSHSALLLVSREVLFENPDFLADLQQSLEDLGRRDYPQVLVLDDLQGDTQRAAAVTSALPEDLAYVIYTSGSTGVPKGAMIEQRGMINHLWVKVNDLAIREPDVVAQTASQSFDISVWQYLAPLLTGARVCIVPDEITKDPLALVSTVERESITVLEIVPSMLQTMLDVADGHAWGAPEQLPLRWLVSTGEALNPELSRRWLALYPGIRLMNAYGPTECSDDVTQAVIDSPPGPDENISPIGFPVSGMTARILDSRLRPVPTEFRGELCFAGVGVGRGYFDDPFRTAEVFKPDPYTGVPGIRMYQTGDIGRRRRDGRLEFFGRTDQQVKLRGHRIELAEIESELSKHPGLRQALIIARENNGHSTRLDAYVVTAAAQAPSATELRAFLMNSLPEYMVPSEFVFLNQFPLTANGKIDRGALPFPESKDRAADQAYIAPRNRLEQQIADLFAQVLGLERVGVKDNFFELGGHSLAATRLAFAVRQAFDVDLPLQTLFTNTDVERLAGKVEELLLQEIEELDEGSAAELLSGRH
ncbi:MAG TPA: amino acid adenylation domain-containing protein [Blastocatellia bacterium]